MEPLTPSKATLSDTFCWLHTGWLTFMSAWKHSAAYAAIFAFLGFAQFYWVIQSGLTPLVVALSGGFMLIGPALLCGFFNMADQLEQQAPARLSYFFQGFRRSPPGLWVIAVIEMFLFLIWLTDAGVAYGIYFGLTPNMNLPAFLAGLAGEGNTWPYLIFTGVVGTILAMIIYATSALAVPLLYYRRTNLTGAVGASVRAVFGNFPAMMAWGLLLSVAMFGTLLLALPLFPVVFPVLAYASRAVYRHIFPL
ncbi:MAG: DUF2189 domain-containing protein [Sulfuricellaceae bacterium]|nr:DUF2189 domain-containing protein [Sulfuricellaceae bacterium]